MASATSLLRDWELLQRRVIPPLLETHHPKAWTIGRAEDAAALALAYDHANSADDSDLQVFLSGRPSGRVQFSLGDIRCLPRSSRPSALHHEERRWVPDRHITERVILATPGEPVDLLAIRIRPHAGAIDNSALSALSRLRRGGHLLFAEPLPDDGWEAVRRDFRQVGPTGRLFVKTSPACRDKGSVPVEDPVSLASREDHASLVETHANLARSLARRFSHHGEMADDLEQVALLALVKAARRYSPEHGSSFATFATASVMGELKRHFRDKTWMLRVPRSLQETYLAVKAAREELGQTLGTSPTVQQIAAHLGTTDEAVLAAMEAGDSYWPASLDTPRKNDEDSVTDVPVVDAGFDSSLDRRQLRESLPKLEQREQLILKRLYFDGWTQRRVAEEIGVSQMQVSRLMARTLAKLRESFRE
jgi:RNA polymerase sigma-B factor